MALRVFVHAARVAVNGRNGFVTRRRHLSTAAGVDTEGIELKISNPNAILNSIATQYESTRKILMEYVDNSLDSAEEILRDNPAHTPTYASTKRYPYKVCVNVDIDRRPQRRSVWIRDNCAGMDVEQLTRLVSGIGNSKKKSTPWMNGQFGFGIQAFRGAAQSFDIYTTQRGLPTIYHLHVDRDQADGIQAPMACSSVEIEANPYVQGLVKSRVRNLGILQASDVIDAHGTSICISKFDPVWFDSVTRRGMVAEIEKHFENLLHRDNLCIEVSEINKSGLAAVQTCMPFDYSTLKGEHINATFTTSDGEDIECRLVVSTSNVRGKRARFFKNGRCIDYVSELRSFLSHSKYGSKLWAHPSVLGYIEVGRSLDPVLTRNEFKRTLRRKEVYDLLYSMEEHLMHVLNEVVLLETDKSMAALEAVLGDSMAALLRMDQRALKEERNADVPTSENHNEHTATDSVQITTVEHEDVIYEPLKTSRRDRTRQQRRAYGYDIQFVRTQAKQEEERVEDEPRSFAAGNVIYINMDHKDFVERADIDKSGKPRLSARLAAYLANELSCHYRLGYYEKMSSEVPSERNKLYHDLFDSVYTMEDLLVKKLDTLRKHIAKGVDLDVDTDHEVANAHTKTSQPRVPLPPTEQ